MTDGEDEITPVERIKCRSSYQPTDVAQVYKNKAFETVLKVLKSPFNICRLILMMTARIIDKLGAACRK